MQLMATNNAFAETPENSHIYRVKPEAVEKRARLKEIIAEKTFRTGEPFTLASGQTSTFYFNTKPTMLDPEGASLIAHLMLDALEDTKADFIGGLEMGAVPIASFVAPASFARGQPLRAFIVRKNPKDHGTQSLIEGLMKEESLSGKKVIIVEDVTTTGGSAVKAAEIVQAEGAEVVQVFTIVDRQEGATGIFEEKGLSFTALFGANEFKQS